MNLKNYQKPTLYIFLTKNGYRYFYYSNVLAMIWRSDRIVLHGSILVGVIHQSSPGPGNHHKSSIKTHKRVYLNRFASGLHDMANASADGVAQKFQPSAFFEMQD